MRSTLPKNVPTRVCYTGTKVSTKFNSINDQVKKPYQQDAVRYITCPQVGCVEDCISETGTRLNEKVVDHNWRDKNSHLQKQSRQSNHLCCIE